ncbi:MAG: LysR substrate-binding domain-containing protein [Burkholderiaceae bacterium]
MDLRGLRYFLAVAQELHFGRAAARLHISQPPLTQHVKKLEADLGVLLFDRNKRSVRLTAAGEALMLEARRLLGDVEGLRRVVRIAQSGETGLLRAGFMSSAPFARARELYACLAQRLPGVSVIWHGLTSSEQAHALRMQQIDLAFLHLPADTDGLRVVPIVRDQLVMAVHASHPMAGRRQARLEAFRDDGFILPPRESAPGLHDLIVATCLQAGFSPSIPHRARDMLAMISLVSIGAGVSIVPRWLTAAGFPDVRFLRLHASPTVELALAWNPDNRSPVLARALVALQGMLDVPETAGSRSAARPPAAASPSSAARPPARIRPEPRHSAGARGSTGPTSGTRSPGTPRTRRAGSR